MECSARELKWEEDRRADDEFYYLYLLETRDKLYNNIIFEFKLADYLYKLNLHTILWKEYNCFIDYKLFHILNLPNDIKLKIFEYVFKNCTEKIFNHG